MSQKYYTEDHEWIEEGPDDLATVGITHHAQTEIGDVVYVDLPEVGAQFEKGEEAAVIESVKAAFDIYAPVSGTIAEVNSALEEAPEQVNEDSEITGWLFKLKMTDRSELEGLMDEAAYKTLIDKQK